MAVERESHEILTRLLSAFAMAAVALAMLWLGSYWFLCLVAGIGGAMSWEWTRAVRGVSFDVGLIIQILSLTLAILVVTSSGLLPACAVLCAGAMILFAWCPRSDRLMSAIGIFYVGLPAIALVSLRSDPEFGFAAVLLVLVSIWSHDTFAMIVGRVLGGPKLWPGLSPNKTWTGVIGGVTASACAGAVFGQFYDAASTLQLTAIGLALGVAGLAGDLIESAFKRRYGLKHASDLIPGHGGVMDRLDGVVIAAIVAMAIGAWFGPDAPSRALLNLQ
ncbi:MAG: phosphatidate cytidylyltransferase [Hyphomicrobiaceae bacterium]